MKASILYYCLLLLNSISGSSPVPPAILLDRFPTSNLESLEPVANAALNDSLVVDSLALVALYQATDWDNWTNNGNWLSSEPISSWHGITFDANLGRVKEINLSSNNLIGSIPTQLGQITSLTRLFLHQNQISGQIPIELGNLIQLTVLSIHNNNLNGPIPKELGNLTRLVEIHLQFNQLSDQIPIDLVNLSLLTRLYLQNNLLTGCFPDSLSSICPLGFNEDTFSDGYNFTGNPGLPWQGDFERFCNAEPQIGAPCDDGDPLTSLDTITSECFCAGSIIRIYQR